MGWNKDWTLLYYVYTWFWLFSIGGIGCVNGEGEKFLEKFQEYSSVIQYLKQMQSQHPNLLELQTIGYTVENREIVLAKIGTRTGDPAKPSIWIDSAMHAREWVSVSVSQYIIDTLVKQYDHNNITKSYVDKVTWYIVPILNPDGYEYSRKQDFTGNRPHFLWRKNRRPTQCIKGTCCYGVDLNRNFGFHWGSNKEGHSSNDACDDQYIGPNAFSEPETAAVRDFLLQHIDTVKAYFSLHSYAQMWFLPFGYNTGTYPSDYEELRDLAYRATEAIREVRGTTYTVGTSADIYYPASGLACDWVKGVAGVKYAYGVELPPERDAEMSAFLVSWEQIEPTAKETWKGIKVVADEVIQKYGRR